MVLLLQQLSKQQLSKQQQQQQLQSKNRFHFLLTRQKQQQKQLILVVLLSIYYCCYYNVCHLCDILVQVPTTGTSTNRVVTGTSTGTGSNTGTIMAFTIIATTLSKSKNTFVQPTYGIQRQRHLQQIQQYKHFEDDTKNKNNDNNSISSISSISSIGTSINDERQQEQQTDNAIKIMKNFDISDAEEWIDDDDEYEYQYDDDDDDDDYIDFDTEEELVAVDDDDVTDEFFTSDEYKDKFSLGNDKDNDNNLLIPTILGTSTTSTGNQQSTTLLVYNKDHNKTNANKNNGKVVSTQLSTITTINSSLPLSINNDKNNNIYLSINDELVTQQLLVCNINVSYFYLKNELNFSEDTMWKITYDASSALGMTTQTIRNKVIVLQQYLNLSLYELELLLYKQPSILHLSANKNIIPTIQLLQSLLYLSSTNTNDIQQLKNLLLQIPSIVTYSQTMIRTKIRFLRTELQLSINELHSILQQQPKILLLSIQYNLQIKIKFLLNDIQLSRNSLKIIVLHNPKILLYNIEYNLIPKLINYMILTIQLELYHIEKILLTFPQILNYNLNNHILLITYYFVDVLHYTISNEFKMILIKFPKLFSYSLTKIKILIQYLQNDSSILCLSTTQIKRVLYQAPQIIGYNINTVHNKIQYIQTILNCTNNEITKIIVAMPTLLILNNITNIQPKIDYLYSVFTNNTNNNTICYSNSSNRNTIVKDTVLRLPTLLGYSLNKRIIPRIQTLLDNNLDPAICITIGIPMSEDKFTIWVQRKVFVQQQQQEKLRLLQEQQQQQQQQIDNTVTAKTTTQEKNIGYISKNNYNSSSVIPAQVLTMDNEYTKSDRIIHWTHSQ